MRIAMLTNNYKPFVGGVPISIERLAEGLRNSGQEVYIFAPSYHNAEVEPFVIRYGSRRKKLNGELTIPKFAALELDRTFADMNFDVIHVHHPVISGYIGCYLGKKYRIPVVFTHHTRYEQYLHYFNVFNNKYPQRLKLAAEKLVIEHNKIFTNHCDMILAPTPGIKTFLQENGTVKDIEVLPTGLLSKDFAYYPKEAKDLRNKYGADGKRLFCTVSRLEEEKNISFLIEALKMFKDRKVEDFRLLIIGEGTQKNNLQAKVADYGLEKEVVFVGSIPNEEINSYYNVCDLFLFASKTETQGIVVLEAMAAGLPVVAVDATGVEDVVKSGINGYLTEEKVVDWVDKLECLCKDNELYQNMRVAARKEASKYNEADIAKTALRFYDAAIIIKEMERSYEKKTI